MALASQDSKRHRVRRALHQVRRALTSLGPFDYLATAVLVAVYAIGTSLDDGPGTSIDFYRSAATVIPTLLIAVAIQGRVLERPVRRRPPGAQPASEADMTQPSFAITPIGTVESPLTDPVSAPKQGDEGAPEAWLAFDPEVVEALDGIQVGDEVLLLTWFHLARRDVLRVHPRGDVSRAQQGVFSTRSPHRPNPIGLHRVEIASIDGGRVRVRNLEAVDGTPIVDVKPVLSGDISER
jgi:tRNA-Thr(GGU) m(6)t(6)A37 methyltransferase TsaA